MVADNTVADGDESAEQKSDIEELMYDYAVEPVPQEKRRSWFGTLTVWAGWTISITAFLVGGLVGAGLPLEQAIPAILTGNIILAVVGAMMGYIGMRSGLTTYMLAHTVFGKYGSLAVILVIGVFAMGFVGVFAGATGQFLESGAGLPFAVGAFLFVVFVVSTALFGFLGLEYLSKVAVPGLWILSIVALWAVSQQVDGGLMTVWDIQPQDQASFMFGVTLAISVWITGASITPDIGRYAKNKWHVLIGAFGGWVFGAAFLETVSATAALGVGEGDLVQVMIDLGLFLPALFVFLAAMWTTGDTNLYIFSLAFTSLSRLLNVDHVLNKKAWVIIGGIAVFVGALMGLYDRFQDFLLTIAIAVPPMAGIFISKFFVLGHYKKTADEIYRDINQVTTVVSIPALVTWIVASGVAFYIEFAAGVGEPATIGLIVAVVLFAVLYKLVPEKYDKYR